MCSDCQREGFTLKKFLSLLLISMFIIVSVTSAHAFPFFKKKSSFPSKEFRSYLLFQDSWGDFPKIFFDNTREEVTAEIGEPSEESTFRSFSMDNYGKTGVIYSRVSFSTLEVIAFAFRRFSPVIGNRVSEGYARQAGWTVRNSSSGTRYMEREIPDWNGASWTIVYFMENDIEVFMKKEEARYNGFLEE
jgi:hypothetical protein